MIGTECGTFQGSGTFQEVEHFIDEEGLFIDHVGHFNEILIKPFSVGVCLQIGKEWLYAIRKNITPNSG